MEQITSKLYPVTYMASLLIGLSKFTNHKEMLQLPMATSFNQKLDFDLLKKAFNIEIERNDCLRLRFKKQKGEWFQYFIPAYEETRFPYVDFTGKTEQEMYDYFSKDASKPMRFKKGELYRIILFTAPDGNSGIFLNVSHFIVDGGALFLILADLLQVYEALATGAEMPKPLATFESCMQTDLKYMADTERQNEDRAFFKEMVSKCGEPIYTSLGGTEYLEQQRKKKKNPNLRRVPFNMIVKPKTWSKGYHISPELTEQINRFCAANSMSQQNLLQFATRMYLAKVNNTDDVMLNVICNRRPTLSDRRSGGLRANGLPYRTIFDENLTAIDALNQSSQQLSEFYRHADFPTYHQYDIYKDLYGLSRSDSYDSVTINFMPSIPLPIADLKAKVQWISPGYFMANVYYMAFNNLWDGGLDLVFECRHNITKVEDVDRFVDGLQKIMQACIDNPQITLHDISHKVL